MQEKVKQHLTKLHATLDKEFKDLSGLRNELILAKNYSLATEIQRLEERLHSLQIIALVQMEELSPVAGPSHKNPFLNDNVD